MRLSLRAGSVLEWLALRAGLVPTPAAEAWGGMALSGVLVAATQVGLTERLAASPGTIEEIATDLGLHPTPLRLLLDCLTSTGHVTLRSGRYRLSRSSRRWLDPKSDLSVARFVAGTGDYWTWWADLPEVTRTGAPVGHHDAPADDPYWRRYISGQFELARLSAAEVARRIRVPEHARTVLDIGGGHGWYSALLCRRHPRLAATVLDLPGSARVGREIVAAAGLSDRIEHRDGDALSSDLGGPYDLVLCFNLLHHLAEDQVVDLLRRVNGSLAEHGSVAILDGFVDPARRGSAAGHFLGLFTYLSSGSRSYHPAQVRTWLARTGFEPPRTVSVRRIPGLELYQARRA
jgi:SAM-dependent methyltransferase